MVADTQLANAQLDLTQQHLYTLSPGTRQIVQGLKEPITLRLFYSRQLGSTHARIRRVCGPRARDCCRSTRGISGGKIKLEFYDPEPFSDTEDRAMAYGLQGVPVDQFRRAGLFRPRRDQPARRRAHGCVLPAGARAVPRIRPLPADLRTVEPEAPGDRRDVVAAARRRPAHDDDDARPGRRRRSVGVDAAAAADVRGQERGHSTRR